MSLAVCLPHASLKPNTRQEINDRGLVERTNVWCTVRAEFLALRLLLEVVLQLIRWGRPIQTSAPGE